MNEDVLNIPLALTSVSGTHPFLIFVLFISFSLIPFALLSVTSFVKLSVVFSIFRNALGAGQIPSGMIVSLLSIVLSVIIMLPVFEEVSESIIVTWREHSAGTGKTKSKPIITVRNLIDTAGAGAKPLAEFLKNQAGVRERVFFAKMALSQRGKKNVGEVENTNSATPIECAGETSNIRVKANGKERACLVYGESFLTLLPAFLITELQEAFAIGFLLFLPFLIVDLVVANILVGLGMMMVSPMVVSLPLKILLFVLCDGWFLLCQSLILGYQLS